MTIRIEILAGEARTAFHFEGRSINVGSAADNDVVLDHPSVRALHCTIREDSLYGFQVDTSGNVALVTDGETISIGKYEAVLYDHEEPCAAEKVFLTDLAARPHDEALRLVYADWLEEEARFEEASFIRVQLSIPKLHPQNDVLELGRLTTKLERDARELPLSWRRIVARAPIENCDLKFAFECPKQWASLAPTDNPTQRFCDACQKRVHYAPTVARARLLAGRGHCVAVDLTENRRENDLYEVRLQQRLGSVIQMPQKPLRR